MLSSLTYIYICIFIEKVWEEIKSSYSWEVGVEEQTGFFYFFIFILLIYICF